MLRCYSNLGSWLRAHITVFSGLFLGLRTDLESTKGGTIDVEGADSHCLIVRTVYILRNLLQDTITKNSEVNVQDSGLPVFGS